MKARGEKDITLLIKDSRTRAITIRLRHKFTMFPQSSYPYRNSSGHSCNTGFILVINTGFIIIGINLILYCISIVTNTTSITNSGRYSHIHVVYGNRLPTGPGEASLAVSKGPSRSGRQLRVTRS